MKKFTVKYNGNKFEIEANDIQDAQNRAVGICCEEGDGIEELEVYQTSYKIVETISNRILDKNILGLEKAQESERTLSWGLSRKEEEYKLEIIEENE